MLLLLDSASLYYRSFFALPESMRAPDGRPNNALRGFLTTLSRLVERFQPTGLAACWDADWRPQWRVDLVPSYKTHRLAADGAEGAQAEQEPASLGAQVDAIAGILDALGVARPAAAGHEADDVIASLAAQCPGPAVVVTGDRDLVQVVRAGVRVLMAVNGGMEKWPLLDETGVQERFGVRADQYVDYAVMRGDPSDGLPGVAGIGAKTAASLLASHGDLDGLLAAAARGPQKPLTARIAAVLLADPQALLAARRVAMAVTDLPLDVDTGLPIEPRDPARLEALSGEWGVSRFVPSLPMGPK